MVVRGFVSRDVARRPVYRDFARRGRHIRERRLEVLLKPPSRVLLRRRRVVTVDVSARSVPIA
jgi:hypothetical protein